ncbi:MAG: DUF2946 domain-containing protein [Pseudomonadota bacterium]
MTKACTIRIMRTFLSVAIALQLIAPSALMATAPFGGDATLWICAPSGSTITSEKAAVQAAANELFDLIRQQEDHPSSDGDHCPLCVLSPQAFIPNVAQSVIPTRSHSGSHAIIYDIGHYLEATGPPVGTRAPPTLN